MSLYGIQNDRAAHASYWNKADPTMQQKVAFTFGHFPFYSGARIADMGCGRGEGSFHLAISNPSIQIVGVDNNPDHVALAKEKYAAKASNLDFLVANIEDLSVSRHGVFDGFLNSSVLHHVYSFNNYQEEPVRKALAAQYEALKPGGVIVTRDFLRPSGDAFVFLDLPQGTTGSSVQEMSSADLLVHYARTANSLLSNPADRGFFFSEEKAPKEGWRRFYLPEHWAHEFLLRKDYRAAYDGEVMEQYAFWTEGDWARELASLGGRVLYKGPFSNRWIVQNRWVGQGALWDEQGNPMPFPCTNYISIVQKAAPKAGIYVGERSVSSTPKKYLRLSSHRNQQTGFIYDMASRPGEVVDCLPYAIDRGELLVLAKEGYPRPLVNAAPRRTANLDGKHFSGHLVEPLALANIAHGEDFSARLAEKAGLEANVFAPPQQALTYYPAAGLADEIVTSHFVPVNAGVFRKDGCVLSAIPPSVSGFSKSGVVRQYRAQDLLLSAQVGILPEARLELNLYALLRQVGHAPGAWLDGQMKKPPVSFFAMSESKTLFAFGARQAFEPCEESGGYIAHCRSLFEERSKEGQIAAREHEFIVTTKASMNAAVAIPLARNEAGEICIGMKAIDLPAPQEREGNSLMFVAPIYRLPFEVTDIGQAQRHLASHLGCAPEQTQRLGEGFFSSIGMMPEKLYPFAAFVQPDRIKEYLHFVKLTDFFAHLEKWRDAPLMIGGLRAIHSLGLWDDGVKAMKMLPPENLPKPSARQRGLAPSAGG